MNIATAIRPQPMARETFHAFQIAISGGRAHDLGEFDTLDEALDRFTVHKATYCVRVANMLTGSALVKFYAVKRKSKPAYRYHDYQTRAIHDTYAEHLFDLDAGALSVTAEEWARAEGEL